MTNIKRKTIKIASIILTITYVIWGACFIGVLTSCDEKNIDFTNGIVINYENLNNDDKIVMI